MALKGPGGIKVPDNPRPGQKPKPLPAGRINSAQPPGAMLQDKVNQIAKQQKVKPALPKVGGPTQGAVPQPPKQAIGGGPQFIKQLRPPTGPYITPQDQLRPKSGNPVKIQPVNPVTSSGGKPKKNSGSGKLRPTKAGPGRINY